MFLLVSLPVVAFSPPPRVIIHFVPFNGKTGYISQSRPYLSHTLIAHEGVAPLRDTRLSIVKPSGATACIWSCGLELAFAPLSVRASCTPNFVSTRKIIIAVRF